MRLQFLSSLLFALLLPAQERGELFAAVHETLAASFHDARFRKEQLPALAARYRDLARATASLAEERAVIHAFLAEIPASHLALYSRSTYEHLLAELQGKAAPTLGLELVERGGRYFVHDVLEGGPAAAAGVLRGDRVLAVDGVPTGGSARLDARSDDAALPDRPQHLLLAADGERVRLAIERRPGEAQEFEVVAARYSALLATRASIRVLERSGRSIGYLRLRFMHMTGVPQLVQDALAKALAGCEAVVLDLRGRGGNAAAVTALARVLAQHQDRFRFVFLVDQQARSAKEALAHEIRRQGLGPLVGERTAGALLPATFQDVGQDSVLMFPSFTLGALSREIEGKGVEVDIEAPAPGPYSAGADPILAAGLAAALSAAQPRRALLR